jgi:ABC-2 type transport system ATP-binding protein
VSVVEVENLCVKYGDVCAVDGLSFRAEGGEVTAVLGPNGAGKTSTIECLEGYIRPHAGRLAVCGLDPSSDQRALSEHIGVMAQTPGIYTAIRPREVLRLFASYYANPRDPDELLDLVGLRAQARSKFRSLSGGEKQRLSLALALVGRPKVAFLDEPTAGVDISGRRLLRDVIRGLTADGVAVVLTSHDLAEVEEVADRIVIIDGGRAVADGTVQELQTAAASSTLTFRAEPGLDVASLTAVLAHTVTEAEPGNYVVNAAPTPQLVHQITTWFSERNLLVGDLQAGRRSLEEVFLKLTADETESPANDSSGRTSRRRSRR